jgi:hypothetical protein
VGFTTGRELHPAPKDEYSIMMIILLSYVFREQLGVKKNGSPLIGLPFGLNANRLLISWNLLRLEYGRISYRANSHALWRIKTSHALHAGRGVDHVRGTFSN